jgi:hypothetical protein
MKALTRTSYPIPRLSMPSSGCSELNACADICIASTTLLPYRKPVSLQFAGTLRPDWSVDTIAFYLIQYIASVGEFKFR